KFVDVEITDVYPNSLRGKVVRTEDQTPVRSTFSASTEQCRRLHADQCAQRRWLDASAAVILRQDVWLYPCNRD
ncbi:hypothetical protein BMR86_25165, partial [Stenotrophomonas sp. KAs 5-3]